MSTGVAKPKKEAKGAKLKRAFEIFSKIEYSADGFVKRYPEEKEYQEAINILGDEIAKIGR